MKLPSFKFNWGSSSNAPPKKDTGGNVPPTSARKSQPSLENNYINIKDGLKFINTGFVREIIPVIRKLSWVNEDLGLALNDMVQLTNTGHIIKFDQKTPTEQRDRMRTHLTDVRKTWGDGVHGINGIVNKMISQIWISGALSCEWVVNNEKRGLKNCVLVNPETIWFVWSKTKGRFFSYQKHNDKVGGIIGEKMVKLNPLTYRYFALNGDTEIPYGIPPYLTALSRLNTQANMDKNIDFIMEQLGLLGFFETLIDKPAQKEGETQAKYEARLDSYLNKVKIAVKDGIKEGSIIGYQDDHEFKFHQTSKNLSGASELIKQNQIKIANGLKTAPEFIGFPTGGSESGMSIIFTKMLSQLVNVQEIVKANLEFGYILELKLAGFDPKGLEVEFKPSTITDELKFQQAQEYKIRNIENKYLAGVIGQQQKAEEMGYDKPDQAASRAPLDVSGKNKQDRKEDKNKSDRKGRTKSKPAPKRKDADTKPK